MRFLDQAWRNFFAGTHHRATWRKRGGSEGLRVVGPQALRVGAGNGRWSAALVPKVGRVRFRRTGALAGWQKAPSRVEKVNPAYTSQTCNACKHIASESRKNQAEFTCVACGHQDHADLNATRNIAERSTAAGPAVAARGDRVRLARSVKREPQLVAS